MRVREAAPGVWMALEWTRGTQHEAARELLRRLLRRVARTAAAAPIAAEPAGRPYLPDHPGLGISVSHDGPLVAAAVAVDRQVGVDVQNPPGDVHARTARRILGRHAPGVLAASDGGRYELAAVWSAQEACVKAAGTGLAGRPWAIPVDPYHPAGRWRGYRWITLRRDPAPISVAFSATNHLGAFDD
jgi:4'-phosphopantetheinyl transferase